MNKRDEADPDGGQAAGAMGAESFRADGKDGGVRMPGEDGQRLPVTPDGRYFVVRGRLWRCSNPALAEAEREALVSRLMAARRAKGVAMRRGDAEARQLAKAEVDEVKRLLGERGAVWWSDGAKDWNRHMARSSPYAGWYAEIVGDGVVGDAVGELPRGWRRRGV